MILDTREFLFNLLYTEANTELDESELFQRYIFTDATLIRVIEKLIKRFATEEELKSYDEEAARLRFKCFPWDKVYEGKYTGITFYRDRL